MKGTGATIPLSDYYAILKVRFDASSKEIRSAFKRLMLEAHPDKNPHRRDWSERRVRELIEAFEVLGNEKSRSDFDLRRAASSAVTSRRKATARKAVEPFFFRKSDPESKALLILHHLTHRKPGSAVVVLDEMELKFGQGFLRDHLDRQDYLDSLFLLAEYFISKRNYTKAAGHLRDFYTQERVSRFPRHYLPEVVRLLKDLCLKKIPGSSGNAEALRSLHEAGALGLTRAEEGLRLRKMAQIYLDQGDVVEAHRSLDLAEQLFPLSKSFERIRKKIQSAR